LIGLVIGACTEVGKYKLAVLFLPLYTRLKKDTPMDNETRDYIRGVVDSDPGIHYHEILRRLKLSNGLVTYHLKTLEREGYILSRSDGRLRRFYPADMNPVAPSPKLNRVQRLIIGAVRAGGGVGHREITRTLKLPYSTVNRQINKLARLGILRLEKRGFTIKCYIADGTSVDAQNPRS
jgi:predicted transcriptional regulator